MDMIEFREWTKFLIIVIGASIALRTYIVAQRQRRLENSLKMLEIFKSNLYKDDIGEWTRIFISGSEPSGAKEGHFFTEIGHHEAPLDSLFSEGPDDDGANERIVEQIDLLCYEILQGTVDPRVIYSRVGQLMQTTHRWFGPIITEHYPYFAKVMKKYHRKFNEWPTKTYSHCE